MNVFHFQIRDETIEILNDLASKLKDLGVEVRNWGIGSTPSCSHEGDEMKRLTEIHPGNYVFYDLQQQMVTNFTHILRAVFFCTAKTAGIKAAFRSLKTVHTICHFP